MKIVKTLMAAGFLFSINTFGSLSVSAECTSAAECAQEAVETAAQTKSLLEIMIPKGAIMAFNLNSCPTGWDNFEAANGRFLRGIDLENKNIDPDGVRKAGSIQDDRFQNHSHSMDSVQSSAHAPGGRGGHGYQAGPQGYNVARTNAVAADADVRQDSRETRPKNVAVTFCYRK